jgi:hypothetical protein
LIGSVLTLFLAVPTRAASAPPGRLDSWGTRPHGEENIYCRRLD